MIFACVSGNLFRHGHVTASWPDPLWLNKTKAHLPQAPDKKTLKLTRGWSWSRWLRLCAHAHTEEKEGNDWSSASRGHRATSGNYWRRGHNVSSPQREVSQVSAAAAAAAGLDREFTGGGGGGEGGVTSWPPAPHAGVIKQLPTSKNAFFVCLYKHTTK